jgi:hypothetical protein
VNTLDINSITIRHGKHPAPEDLKDPEHIEACVMEFVYLRWALAKGLPVKQIIAGWTDHPPCSSGVLTDVLIVYNDRVKDDVRRSNVLRQVFDDVSQTGGGSRALEERRRWALTDWSVRVATSKLLRAAGMPEWAEKVEALAPITHSGTLDLARATLAACRDASWEKRRLAFASLRNMAAAVVAAEAAVAAAAEAAEAAAVVAAEADRPAD